MDIHNGNCADSTVRHGDVYGLRTYGESRRGETWKI